MEDKREGVMYTYGAVGDTEVLLSTHSTYMCVYTQEHRVMSVATHRVPAYASMHTAANALSTIKLSPAH